MPPSMRKADLNAEEWSLVVDGPAVAGLRMMVADRGGTLRESLSMAKAYAEEREHEGPSELVDEIVASRPDADPLELGGDSVEALVANTMHRLREAVELVERRAPADEAEAYKAFVRKVAVSVARAHKEGGFLGIGGEEVGEGERAALAEIDEVLGRR